MKKTLIALAASLFAVSALSAAGIAAPKATAAPKTISCPVCHMAMPSHKTAMMSVPVPIKGHTYYCCTQCAAGKAHMKAMKGAKPAAKKM